MSKPLPPFSEAAMSLKIGTYRHFKGDNYKVIGVARVSGESDELPEVVVYQGLYEGNPIFVRPIGIFIDTIDRPEYKGPRFTFLSE
jgi:hypothetical protein